MSFVIKETAQSLLSIFAVIFFGYLLGSIRIKGIGLGTAAIFLSGLLFGALGFHASAIMETTGLILFITSVGLSAGPSFLSRMKKDGKRYSLPDHRYDRRARLPDHHSDDAGGCTAGGRSHDWRIHHLARLCRGERGSQHHPCVSHARRGRLWHRISGGLAQ